MDTYIIMKWLSSMEDRIIQLERRYNIPSYVVVGSTALEVLDELESRVEKIKSITRNKAVRV